MDLRQCLKDSPFQEGADHILRAAILEALLLNPGTRQEQPWSQLITYLGYVGNTHIKK